MFDEEYTEDWYRDEFVKRVMQDIDHIDITKSDGITFFNSITEERHTSKELSTGCKTIILIYMYPNVIFQARFGSNCTDLLEEIASKRDVIIKSDYPHAFNFKFIHEIEYINYNVIAKSRQDILDLVFKYREDCLAEHEYDNTDDYNEDEDIAVAHPYLYREFIEAESEGVE
jgi:hypothetical protein